ncbi:MAG: cupin domain-containing protein [Desulfovibrionaceae bacterium]|nr:cupin domain-containing protein [Desulfovibrionaceae bacterium]
MKKNGWKKKMKRVMLAGIFAAGSLAFCGVTQAVETAREYPPVKEVVAGLKQEQGTIFEVGKPNVAYEQYFVGKTFHAGLAKDRINVSNVTFTKGAYNFWHIHHGTCQILVTESGRGYYQIWGKEPQELVPGKVVTIPEGIKHWHGAGPNNMMQHLSIMLTGEGVSTEWLEPVDAVEYAKLK